MCPQIFDGKYVNQYCEYIDFVNDSIVVFMMIGGTKGTLASIYQGVGIYNFEDDYLIVKVVNEPYIITKMDSVIYCSDYKKKFNGIDKYKFERLSDEVIRVTGPIIDDYKKLNRKRYLKSFMNFPWKWSFKKQHWYDPRIRELTLQNLQ